MATTYLQLVNRVLGALNETKLTSSNFATTEDGFANAVKEDINQAIFDVYTEEDIRWSFAWASTTFDTTIGEINYTPLATASTIDWSSFRLVGDGDEIKSNKLKEVEWQVYLNNYYNRDEDTIQEADTDKYSEPKYIVRKPDNSILLTPVPDQAYTIKYEYYTLPTPLAAYSDTISIPDEFSQIIIDKALHYAYMFRDNLESAQLAQDRYEKNVNKVRRILIPQFKNISLL